MRLEISFILFMLCINLNAEQNKFLLVDSLIQNSRVDQAYNYILEIDTNNLNKNDLVEYYYRKGRLERHFENFTQSLASFSRGLNLAGPNNSTARVYDFYCFLSIVSLRLDQHELSLEYADRGMKIAEILQNTSFLYEANFLKSNAYNIKEQFDSSAFYMNQAKRWINKEDVELHANMNLSLSSLYIKAAQYKTALGLLEESNNYFKNEKRIKKLNLIKINQATCYLELGELNKCLPILSEALEIAKKEKYKEHLSKLFILRIKYLALKNEIYEIPKLIDLVSDLEHSKTDSTAQELAIKFNVQFKDNIISDQGKVIKKTEEKLSIESLKAKNRKKGLYLLGLIILGTLALFYFYTKNQRIQHELQLSQEIIQKQTALQSERTRIAAEMHDDLGGGLTTIKFLGQKMLRQIDNIEQKDKLNKIVNNSQALVSNMSEIIWAMNAGFDTLDSLIAYCRRHASEYLRDHNIKLDYSSASTDSKIEFSGEKRRHVFLVFKELLHNIVKHADADMVTVAWKLNSENIVLTITDNGVGMGESLDMDETTLGNGLRNMQARIAQLDGSISWSNLNGLHSKITIPLASLQSYTTA